MSTPHPQGGVPGAKKDPVARALMLFFGLLGLLFGVMELNKVLGNPTMIEVPCDHEAFDHVGEDRWVALPNCAVDYDNVVEVTKRGKLEEVWFPLIPEDVEAAATPIALLVTDDEEVFSGLVRLREADAREDDRAMIDEVLALEMRLAIEGVTRELRGDEEDLARRYFPAARADRPVIEQGARPSIGLVVTGFGAAAILLPLSFFLWRRERRGS